MKGDIFKKVEKIRSLLDNPQMNCSALYKEIEVSQIYACLEVLHDTDLAIEYFYTLDDFTASQGGYLYIYGLMQAFFLQQDAASNLYQFLFKDSKIDWKKISSEIFEIREFRNESIGHPTNRNNSFHFITRASICKESFNLETYYKNGEKPVTANYNLKTIRHYQELSIYKLLDAIIEKLECIFAIQTTI